MPDAYIGFPIAYAEALALLSRIPLSRDLIDLVASEGGSDLDEHERLLLMTLSYGDLSGFVFSERQTRWGRLPSPFWAWQGGLDNALDRGVFGSAVSPLLARGMGDTTAFDRSPIMLMREAIEVFCANLSADQDRGGADTSRPSNPVTLMSTIVSCRKWLIEQFESGVSPAMTRDDFKAAAQDKFEDLSGRSFTQAWGEATEQFPDRRKAGRRPN